MPDELMLPPLRTTDAAERRRQGQALAGVVREVPALHRLRRWLLSLGLGTVVVATAGAGVAYFASAPAPDHSGVFCFTAPGTGSKDLGTSTNYSGAPADAVRACAALWEAGILHLGADLPTPPSTAAQPSAQPAPALVACVYKSEAAVFPGVAGLCQQLGLPALKE
ncbi:hypothetical protein acdb102_12070 [Acidothermaceae bacterium B102]|nr:hypothetical protein acdb102_12070 [Acidothermaceae bacterium B102]